MTTLFATLVRLTMVLFGATQQRGEHFLQAGDQVVGLAGTLGQVFDLVVLDGHLGSEKLNFAILLPQPFFKLFNKFCRDRS